MESQIEPVNRDLMRQKICALEDELKKMPQVEIEPIHYFADGMYAREIHIPAGTVLTGKIHKTAHINVLSQGTIHVWTDQGMQTLHAPHTFVASPGTKRVGLAETDVIWTTFHASKETDLEKLEAELIAPSFEALVNEKEIEVFISGGQT